MIELGESQCASTKPAEPPSAKRRKFVDLPKGTRFRYVGSRQVFAVIETHGNGLIAVWDGPDASASLQGLFSAAEDEHATKALEVEVLESAASLPSDVQRDAERYRWLRSQHWNDSTVTVVREPLFSVRLGVDCPSDERLDALIDAARAQ